MWTKSELWASDTVSEKQETTECPTIADSLNQWWMDTTEYWTTSSPCLAESDKFMI